VIPADTHTHSSVDWALCFKIKIEIKYELLVLAEVTVTLTDGGVA